MSAPSSSSSGFKRKFDSNGSSSSVKKGGDWKKPRGGDRDAGKPWAKPPSDGKPAPRPAGGNGKPWVKAAEWKANTPVAYTRKDRSDMKKERKASKPNADIIAEANKLWQVSLANMSNAERAAKIDELIAAVAGKVAEVGLKHDASRAIQIAIKHASEVQKHKLIAELTGHFRALSEDHYGHYIVIKMLSNDTRKGDAKKKCLVEFKGHVTKLAGKPDSAKVLDFLFASVKAKDQSSLLQEFYSPEFVVFAEDPLTINKNLGELIAVKPEKKVQMIENLRKYLDKSLEKSMLMFRFVHALLLQYLSHAPLADTLTDFLPSLHQFVPALHHSVDGCRIICHLLSVSTSAKDRKSILKHFKGVVGNMAERAEGVWVINCALDVVDDTVLLEKVVLAELIPSIQDQLTHQYSAKIYLHVLNSHDAAIFAAEEQENYSQTGRWILNQSEVVATAGVVQPLSKKDPAQKRLELLGCFLQPILHTLSTLPDTLAALLRSNTGHHLLIEVIREAWRLQHDEEAQAAATAAASGAAPAAGAAGKKGKKKGGKDEAAKEDGEDAGEDGAAPVAAGAAGSKFPASLAKKLGDIATNLGYIFDALVAECARPLGDASDAALPSAASRGAKPNALEDRFGHYVVKRLLVHLVPAPRAFAEKLLSQAVEPQLALMATTNRPAFVLAAYMETEALRVEANQLRKMLKPLLPQIVAAAGSAPAAPVAKSEEAADENMGVAENKAWNKKHTYATHSTTSAGVSLLSKLLQGLPTDKHPAAAASAAAGKKGAAASAASAAAAAAPATPAAKPSAAAAKSAKKAAPAAAVAEPVKAEEAEEPAAAASAAPATPARGHKRQWTHTALDGTKGSRLHRSPAPPVAEEPEAEAAAAPAPKAAKTPAKKAAKTPAKSAKKAAQSDDMEE